jgi:hypothetical protein
MSKCHEDTDTVLHVADRKKKTIRDKSPQGQAANQDILTLQDKYRGEAGWQMSSYAACYRLIVSVSVQVNK